MSDQNHIETAAQLAREASAIRWIGQSEVYSGPAEPESPHPVAILPDGHKVEDLEQFLPAPLRKRGTVKFQEAASFARYIQDHKSNETAIFCQTSEQGGKFKAVLDYHGHDQDAPAWCQHIALYDCPTSPEWNRWTTYHGKPISQGEFAEFLELNVGDIREPAGAAVLEIVSKLNAKISVDFSSAIRLDNGNVQFTYEERTEAKAGRAGNMEVPPKFTLGIPVFRGGPKYALDALLRYRIQEKRLVFIYALVNPHKIIEDACNELIETVRKATSVDPYMGWPA
jgi:uncharacterized protein YfdQ (DUF2303 family)